MQGGLVWVVLLTLGASPAGKAPSVHELESLVQRLGAMAKEAEDDGVRSDAMADMPEWLVSQSPEPTVVSVRRHIPLAGADHAQLIALIASKPSAEVLALALIRLGMHADPGDLRVIEPFVTEEITAGFLPHILITQQVQRTYPVYFLPLSLQKAALAAASTIAGQRLHSSDAYQAWRQDNPDVTRSLRFWESRLRRVPADEGAQMLASLQQSDPSTYARLLLMHDPNTHVPVPQEEQYAFLTKRLGPDRMLRILARDAPWDDLEDNSLYRNAARGILDGGPTLLGGRYDGLLALWRSRLESPEGSPRTQKPTDEAASAQCLEADMAVALSRMAPEGAADFLRRALEKSHCGHGVMLGALARCCPGETALLGDWLGWASTKEVLAVERAILEGLAQGAGPEDRQVRAQALARALRKVPPPFKAVARDPSRVRVWLGVAEALGGPKDLPAAGGIWGRGTGKRQGKHRRMTPADEARAQKARESCISAIREWLGTL